jgi:hypothetical protein
MTEEVTGLKVYVGFDHCKTKRSKRGRRGEASAIGTVFFVVIAIILVSFLYEISQSNITTNQYAQEAMEENVTCSCQYIGNGNILIDAVNNGRLPATLTRLWVIDETNNTHYAYSLNITISPWSETKIYSDNASIIPKSNWTAVTTAHDYLIRLITQRGNTAEYYLSAKTTIVILYSTVTTLNTTTTSTSTYFSTTTTTTSGTTSTTSTPTQTTTITITSPTTTYTYTFTIVFTTTV